MEDDFYILDTRGHPVREADERHWSQWQETDQRRFLCTDEWESEEGIVTVMTTFLGFDPLHHNPPALWDTVAFITKGDGEPERIDDYQWHYTSRKQALLGHAQMVRNLSGSGAQGNGWRQNIDGWFPPVVLAGIRLADLLSDGKADGTIRILTRCIHM